MGTVQPMKYIKLYLAMVLQWERYMLCDGSPDLLSTSELNTYVNLWRDDNEIKPFNMVLKEGEDTLKVIW